MNSVLDFKFNLKSFNVLTWVPLGASTTVITWPKRPELATKSSVVLVFGAVTIDFFLI